MNFGVIFVTSSATSKLSSIPWRLSNAFTTSTFSAEHATNSGVTPFTTSFSIPPLSKIASTTLALSFAHATCNGDSPRIF